MERSGLVRWPREFRDGAWWYIRDCGVDANLGAERSGSDSERDGEVDLSADLGGAWAGRDGGRRPADHDVLLRGLVSAEPRWHVVTWDRARDADVGHLLGPPAGW